MKVDMQCPKCGKESTEYDDGKWKCLYCGNKFIFSPTKPPEYTTNNFVNISNDSRYDLDVQRAVRGKKIDDGPTRQFAIQELRRRKKLSEDAKEYLIRSNSFSNQFAFFSLIGLPVALLIAFNTKYGEAIGILLVLFFLIFMFKDFTFDSRAVLEEKRALVKAYEKGSLEEYLNIDTKILGYKPICPYCRKEFDDTHSFMPSEQMMVHCLKCGKQFIYIEPNSYPIKST